MNTSRLNWRWPLGALLFGLLVTALLSWSVNRYVQHNEVQRFNRQSERLAAAIAGRLDDLQHLLLAGRGLFDASNNVSYVEWERFTRAIDYNSYYGMMGFGFIQRVPAAERTAFEREATREDGRPLRIRQLDAAPAHSDLFVIRYIEPLATNTPARGLDVGSGISRREAARAAMLSGQVRMSKRITLVQDRNKVAGFLILAPVYRTRQLPATLAGRERDLLGWVYMPLRISELMEGVASQVEAMVDFELFEGVAPSRQSLLYDADGHFEKSGDAELDARHFTGRAFHRVTRMNLYGQSWTLYTSTRPEFDATANTSLVRAVAASGLAISLLLAAVAWALARTRSRALSLADDMMHAAHEQEAKLRDSEERLSAIVDSAMDAIITIHTDGRIEHFNPSAERIFGYVPDEVRGQNIKMLMPEPYQSAHDGYLSHYQATGTRQIIGTVREVEGRRKNGETFPMELSVSEARVQGQAIYTGIVRDITERKKVERMKSEFISTVSHELRTPLTSIRGSLGLVLGGAVGEVSAQVTGLLDIAKGNAERLVRLINDILDIEKIESGKVRFQPTPQALQPLVEQAIAANAGYAEQHRVTLELAWQTGEVRVNVDSDRFMQIMGNLLSNAIKYSPRGGVVTVRVSERTGRTLIEVIDRGPGVPDEFKARMFQKFSQADSSDTRAKGGTGLGLSIVKSLIEHMGGQVGCESAPGAGANFHFDLPVLTRSENEPGHNDRARVLYVEDDPDLHRVVQTLTGGVALLDSAASLEEARRLLAERRYDLVMIDVVLPDGIAWELLPLVKALDAPPPVVVFSAQEVGEREAREVAATFIKSQTSNEALLRTITSLLAKRVA